MVRRKWRRQIGLLDILRQPISPIGLRAQVAGRRRRRRATLASLLGLEHWSLGRTAAAGIRFLAMPSRAHLRSFSVGIMAGSASADPTTSWIT